MTDPTLDAIRRRHTEYKTHDMDDAPCSRCNSCDQAWPCDAITLLDRLAALEEKLPTCLRGAHYTNLLIRINGKDKVFEADYLKHYSKEIR